MNVLRTPESRFADLPDYRFALRYHQVTPEPRLHYVDERPRDAAPVLMLHGEPTWSYLYRHMIPPVAAAGLPSLVPVTPDNPATKANRNAWKVFERWVKPFICCFSDGDPIT